MNQLYMGNKNYNLVIHHLLCSQVAEVSIETKAFYGATLRRVKSESTVYYGLLQLSQDVTRCSAVVAGQPTDLHLEPDTYQVPCAPPKSSQ